MKLKHIFLTATMALFAASASAGTADDLKIYINPGHGSWGPNNRHCATIGHSPISTANPDTTDFFESNTNLRKALAMFHRLVDLGLKNDTRNGLDLSQNVVMSHVKCGPYPYKYIYNYTYTTDSLGNQVKTDSVLIQNPDQNNAYNRVLSEIAEEADEFGADQFVSIHSNAASEGNTVNYLYFAYDGYGSDADKNAHSAEMSRCGWNHRILDRHTKWTHYDYTMTKDDLANGKGKIGTQKLGVLRSDIPGYLVEGYFHTYQPARHRAMNFDVDALEGLTYAWGVCDYWGVAKESKGNIYGIVRDHDVKFSHSLYAANATTTDVYKPLNGATVTLKKDGVTVGSYTTDVNYNGAYVFRDLDPGTYTLEFSHADYIDGVYSGIDKSIEATASLEVTVAAAAITYNEAFLRNKEWTPPTINYVNYPDSTAGKGYTLMPKYETKSTSYGLLAAQLAGKTIRRQLLREDKLYVLALDSVNEPYIYLADLAAGTVDTISTKGTQTDSDFADGLKLADIALTADHYLVAGNYSKNTFTPATGTYRAYKWEKDDDGNPTGDPVEWFTSQQCSMYATGRIGQAITYSGTLAEGYLLTTVLHDAGKYNKHFRFAGFTILDGKKATETSSMNNFATSSPWNCGAFGESHSLVPSPYGDGFYKATQNGEEKSFYRFVMDGNNAQPTDFATDGGQMVDCSILATMTDGLVAKTSLNGNFFKFADKTLFVAPDVADGKVSGLKLFDVTDGLTSAKEIALDGVTIDPVEYKYVSAHGELALTLSSDDRTIGAAIELFLVVDGKVYKFTEHDNYVSVTPATGTANPYAYALSSTAIEGKLNVNYLLNADATNVTINIVDEEGEVAATKVQGPQTAGSHTAEISLDKLTKGTYSWEVVVAGAEKSTIETFKSYRFYHPRGCEVDNNMESPSFGNVYVTEGMVTSSSTYWSGTGGGLGLYAFDASMNPIKNEVTGKYAFTGGWTLNQKAGSANAADLARVRLADDGRLFVTRMQDDGDYILYANSFEDLCKNDKFNSLFTGYTFDASTYKYSDADGNFIGAANLALDVKGSGDSLKLLTLSSNSNHWSFVFSGVSCEEYNLGTATTLPVPTIVPQFTGKYTIAPSTTNIEYDNRGGIWYCQYRGAPSDAQPALVYVNADGVEKYKDITTVRGGGGVRLSPDGTKLAVASSKTQFTIYDLVWTEDGTPCLYKDYVITHGIGTSVYDIAWDLAGNIYICGNSSEYLKAFSLPRAEAFTTKAASKYAFNVVAAGVENINAADEDATPVYYNLQGVQVENPENGIYIVKRGNKVTKEYVRR